MLRSRPIETIASVRVHWSRKRVQVQTTDGRGAIHIDSSGNVSNRIPSASDKTITIRQTHIYALLQHISSINEVYRSAGGVHGCAVCHESKVLYFVEDIGRHNATDTVAGQMWLTGINGADKCLYSTGRLTSEIVMKAAQMNIPILLSRSGITHLGLELAIDLGITLVARAKGRHFLVYHGQETIIYDRASKDNEEQYNGNK